MFVAGGCLRVVVRGRRSPAAFWEAHMYCRFDFITFAVLWVDNNCVDCYPLLERGFLEDTKSAQEHKRAM